ncbi:MAG: aspartate aminotransferase family protein [Bacteroidia bacterium]
MNLFNVYPRFDIALTRGEGVYVYDEQNRRYLDLYGGHGVISIGHAHPAYTQRLKQQIDRLGFYSNSIRMPIQDELAQKLTHQSGYTDYRVFLCNSGAEANENAIKLASFHTGRKKIIAFKGSFHGRTAAALNVTDNPRLSAPLNVDNFPVEFVELNNQGQLLDAFSGEEVCAVIVEGIQGVGGLDMPSEDFLAVIKATCEQYGALLIMDEIQSGFGRSGRFFAHQHAHIQADIITMAKGMGNGFPVGGLLIHPQIEASFGMLGTTFGGNHLACAASLAVLETIEQEDLMQNAEQLSEYLTNELQAISAIKKVKGRGLMLGVELDFPIKELRKQLLHEHQIFTGSSANPHVLRILPPLGITKAQIQPFVTTLKTMLS